MAIKLNSNALVNQSIEEEKLASDVQTKLNKESIPDAPDNKDYVRNKGQWKEFAGVEEAPIDGKAYMRKDGGWEKYEYPPLEEPVIREITTAGLNEIQVPPLCHYLEVFLVNGGNGGYDANNRTYIPGDGGGGGYTYITNISVSPLTPINIYIGKGGNRGSLGETTYIEYNDNIYKGANQDYKRTTESMEKGEDGVLNALNPNDTNLYGACGGGGDISDKSPNNGGKTGGGSGGYDYYNSPLGEYATPGDSGSFYGAGGGGGGAAILVEDWATGGKGHHGYAYLKFT